MLFCYEVFVPPHQVSVPEEVQANCISVCAYSHVWHWSSWWLQQRPIHVRWQRLPVKHTNGRTVIVHQRAEKKPLSHSEQQNFPQLLTATRPSNGHAVLTRQTDLELGNLWPLRSISMTDRLSLPSVNYFHSTWGPDRALTVLICQWHIIKA